MTLLVNPCGLIDVWIIVLLYFHLVDPQWKKPSSIVDLITTEPEFISKSVTTFKIPHQKTIHSDLCKYSNVAFTNGNHSMVKENKATNENGVERPSSSSGTQQATNDDDDDDLRTNTLS